MTINMVCQRDYTLRTLSGQTIAFKAGEPTPVAEAAYGEAIAKNIVPVTRLDDDGTAPGMAHAQITGSLRDALIFSALQDAVNRNASEEFDGGGKPKATTIAAATGLQISASEVSKYWANYKQLMGENAPLPTHPNVELVNELQQLVTRKQLTEFASDHDIDYKEAAGKTVKDLKQAMLYQVVNQKQMPAMGDEYVKPSSLTMD